ncbi:MAG: hypothetical protein NVS3B7_04130 [Candidatus Elarobacter sp.]
MHSKVLFARLTAAAAAVILGCSAIAIPENVFAASGARERRGLSGSRPVVPIGFGSVVPFDGKLFDGRSVSIDSGGNVRITTMRGARPVTIERRMLTALQRNAFQAAAHPADRDRALFELAQPRASAYVNNSLIVVFKDGTTIPSDRFAVPEATLRALRVRRLGRAPASLGVPHYTTDDRVNALFAKYAVSRTDRLFGGVARGTLGRYAARAASTTGKPMLNLGNAFAITITNAQLSTALRELAKQPAVAYVGRNYRVSAMAPAVGSVPRAAQDEARSHHPRRAYGRSGPAAGRGRFTLSASGAANAALDNYTVATSGQAMLNAPGVDAIAAFDEIAQNFPGQLPGAGVTITNVSLGDVDDASAATNPADPCNRYVTRFGPTTRMIGNQRYLDLPSMPLIPTYTASSSGTLSGSGEACGMDPFIDEVGLDFSVMAALPHALQRAGEVGTGFTDLLGIAPGASYRLVVPAVHDTPSLLGAILGAATQTPAPDIITMSVGWGLDRLGFPSRYIDDDPLARSVTAAVTALNIPMFIAANDGTRAGVGAAIGPSGGSAATNLAPAGAPNAKLATLDDVGLTTVPSVINDTGTLDVGGTTLDDIASANPQDPANAALAGAHAFPATRFNGLTSFSSGFGSRVNVSAPSDDIIAIGHYGPKADSAIAQIAGGTSASAPEAAAVAAIAIQVARAEGHPFASVSALRSLLAATGTTPAQSAVPDVPLNVGPQVSARRVVEALLADAHVTVQPSVARVAIAQRKAMCDEGFGCNPTVVLENTDPAILSLRLPLGPDGQYTGARTNAYITIAPDWEGLPPAAQFRLTIAGKPKAVLATSADARLLPAQILAAAGMPLASTGARTVSLTYQSTVGLHVVAQTTFDLTFGPADGTSTAVLAPVVPPVVTGDTISVSYDASMLPAKLGVPYLVTYLPDRFDLFSRAVYSQRLSALKGTVAVPVSALAGSGVYAFSLFYGGPNPGVSPTNSSHNSYTRVVVAGSRKPPAPLLGPSPAELGHTVEVPFGRRISVGWDVSSVPGATGAILEVSFGAPTPVGNFNVFNNPNGGELDANGIDSGSVYHQPLSAAAGSTTIDPRTLNVLPGVLHSVRVLATNGTGIIGEASDASALLMDGVAPTDGGTVFAHGVNTTGRDGLLLSVQEGCFSGINQFNYFGSVALGPLTGSAAMTFDQKTLQITNANVVLSSGCNSQPMALGNDSGLYYDRDARAFTAIPSLSAVPPSPQYLSWPAGAIPNDVVFAGSSASPLPSLQALLFQVPQEYVGGDDTSSKVSFFGLNTYGAGVPNQATAFSMDVATGTAGPVMTINDFAGFGYPVVHGATYDPTRNIGYAAVLDAANGDVPATIVATDYTKNSYSLFSSSGLGQGTGAFGYNLLALDASSQKLLLVNDSQAGARPATLHIIDLRSRNVSLVAPPSWARFATVGNVLCDPVNHFFIVITLQRGADTFNVELPSGIDWFDESGNLVKHLTVPYLYFPFVGGDGPGQQLTYVNGRLRRLFLASPPSVGGTFEPQLMAIDY